MKYLNLQLNKYVPLILSLKVEVFDVLFVMEQDRKYVVHCMDCGRKISNILEGFIILNQYRLEELCDVYDRFQLSCHVSIYCYVQEKEYNRTVVVLISISNNNHNFLCTSAV